MSSLAHFIHPYQQQQHNPLPVVVVMKGIDGFGDIVMVVVVIRALVMVAFEIGSSLLNVLHSY